MSAAILDLASKNGISGMAAQIIRAKQFNTVMGTDIRPWELESIPADWLSALEMWVDERPRVAQWQGQVDEALARLRSRKVQGRGRSAVRGPLSAREETFP